MRAVVEVLTSRVAGLRGELERRLDATCAVDERAPAGVELDLDGQALAGAVAARLARADQDLVAVDGRVGLDGAARDLGARDAAADLGRVAGSADRRRQ